jgi:hypothetical protein
MNSPRTALAAVAAAGLAAAGLGLAPVATAAEGVPVVIDCTGTGVTKPKEIVITCADAGITVMNIRWTSWTMNRATGVGTLAWNTCLPQTCVDGIVEKYRVRVTLGGLASGPDIDVFSQMKLRFPKGGPAGLATGSYTLDNEQR